MTSIAQERKDRAESHRRHQMELGKTVMNGFKEGLSNKEIADKIGVAEGVVRQIRVKHEKGGFNGN